MPDKSQYWTQIPIQDAIEQTVTNGLGYRENRKVHPEDFISDGEQSFLSLRLYLTNMEILRPSPNVEARTFIIPFVLKKGSGILGLEIIGTYIPDKKELYRTPIETNSSPAPTARPLDETDFYRRTSQGLVSTLKPEGRFIPNYIGDVALEERRPLRHFIIPNIPRISDEEIVPGVSSDRFGIYNSAQLGINGPFSEDYNFTPKKEVPK